MFEIINNSSWEVDELETLENYVKNISKELKIEKAIFNIIFVDEEEIHHLNKQYRNVDREADVLSFPMFEKSELDDKIKNQDFEYEDVLGDIVISIEKVKGQAEEYGHSFERELSYMIVHGFYHLMGYDHIKEEDKIVMRPKEENILNKLGIRRDDELNEE